MPTTVTSSPGKVLLAGGYLVLDPAYSGLVVATSSRFYTAIRTGVDGQHIRVRSPQFVDSTWTYSWRVNNASQPPKMEVTQIASPSSSGNKFVQLALEKTLSLALEASSASSVSRILADGLDITIVGGNDFYSQQDQLKKMGLPSDMASLAKITPFCPTGVTLKDVSKTGLGSSAALITSLVTALLVHTAIIPESALTGAIGASPAALQARRLAHNAAQFIHCLAQGKVGSGFDVSAAAFGSQIYTRFNPSVIQPLMDDPTLPLYPTLNTENPAWDYKVQPFKLPPHTRIILADIHAGSNTPLLVSQVLKWRKENSTAAHALWTAIDQLNMSLAQTLARLSELHAQDATAYLKVVRYICSLQSVQWLANTSMEPAQLSSLEAFYEAHVLTEQIRAKMREMGTLSGVEIEPPQQTTLLDESVALAGVIGGGVPGAGGYDAIWLLVCDLPESESVPDVRPVSRVERLWGKFANVSPLLSEESKAQGVTLEALESVPGLMALVESK